MNPDEYNSNLNSNTSTSNSSSSTTSNSSKVNNTTNNSNKTNINSSSKNESQSSGNSSEKVYWTPNGKSYHTTKNCSTLSRSKTILDGTISGSGKHDPCDRCH